MRSYEERRDFKSLLLADPDIARVLRPAEVERAFDLEDQFKHVDEIIDRVFSRTRADESRLDPETARESGVPRAMEKV